MSNKNLLEPYHYTECGLDNVYLYNIPIINDIEGEEVVCIPKVNKLHKIIAEGIVYKKGLLDAKEIKFLRTQIGFTQEDFAKLLGKKGLSLGRWERGETKIDITTDILIRMIAIKYLDLKGIDIEALSHMSSMQGVNDNINIDGFQNNYKLMGCCA